MNRFNLCVGGGASRSLKAFTLAEVLITLAIIGVVAALTIPSVITNYKNQETATKLKKTFSTLANITNLAIAEHGPIKSWDIFGERHSGSAAKDFADKYMIPYLKVTKNCGYEVQKGCWYEEGNYATWLNGSQMITSEIESKVTKFVLSDGTFIMFQISENDATNKIADIFVDINGFKKPNKVGRDIFVFRYIILKNGEPKGRLTTHGLKQKVKNIVNSSGNCCNTSESGLYCSGLIYLSGWKIPSKKEYNEIVGNDSYSSKYPW